MDGGGEEGGGALCRYDLLVLLLMSDELGYSGHLLKILSDFVHMK